MIPFFIIVTLLLGIILILIEVFFIPGTTVVGVLGFLAVGAGVWATYYYYGTQMGIYSLVGSGIICLGLVIYGFRSGAWGFMSMNQVIDSKVNDQMVVKLKLGEEGMTVSALRPMGTALFQDEQFEVSTLGSFLEANVKVRIIQVGENNRDIVVEKCG